MSDRLTCPWGELPAIVRAQRLKRVAVLANSKTGDTSRRYLGLENIEPWTGRLIVGNNDQPGDGLSSLFEPGDVLFGKLRPYLAKVALADFSGRCTSELLVLRSARLESRFLQYVLLSELFISVIDASTFGSKMPRAEWEFIGSVFVPVPGREHQVRIADFLDRKTAAIDALIAKKERLIELLQEKRQALITQTVTKGLDPNVPMKESGIAWLGPIPAHWKLVALRRIARVGQGNAFAHAIQGQESGELPWFKVADMNRPGNEIEMISADNYVDREVAEQAQATVFPAGAVIFPRVGAALLTNKRRILKGRSIVDDNTYAVVPGPHIRSRFLYLAFLRVDMAALCSAGLVPTVTFAAIKELPIALPPLDEQDRIVRQIETTCARLDTVATGTQCSVDRLREYRQALITAAITGKVDVTNTPEAA